MASHRNQPFVYTEISYPSKIQPNTSELILDQRLQWTKHIDALKTKCIKALNIMKYLSYTNWVGDQTLLLRLYRSLVRSKLDYGSFFYWTASPNRLAKLDPIHHSALTLCSGAFRTSPIQSLYALTREPSLLHRRQQQALQFYSRSLLQPAHQCTSVHSTPLANSAIQLQHRIQSMSER